VPVSFGLSTHNTNTNTDTAAYGKGKANCKHSHTSFSFLHFPFSQISTQAGCYHYHDARCMVDVDGGDGGNTAGSFTFSW
jgi:hypothetical protein